MTRVIHIQNLGSPSLVVGSNNSARVDQNQVEGSGRRFIGGRSYTEDISYVSLEVPCCKKHSTLIWKSARLEGKALSAVPGKRSSAVSQQKSV